MRQCAVKCKFLHVGFAPIIQCQSYLCQVKIFLFEAIAQVLYNCCIDERETNMTIAEFFADYSDTHYSEFVEHELTKIFQSTIPQDENFDLDVPF